MANQAEHRGQEIAAKARQIRLDKARRASGELKGKKSRFTPARLDHLTKLEDLEAGQVVGVLDTELAGDETTLPPGRYNIYLHKREDGEWEASAEADGQVVATAARVTVREGEKPTAQGPGGGPPLPELSEQGWCWCWWVYAWGIWWLICACW